MKTQVWIGLLVAALFGAAVSDAALIAHYDFGDGNLTDDDSGNDYTLSGPSGGSATITANDDQMGSAHFDGTGGNGQASYFQAALSYPLETSFTVSFWWKTATLDQDSNDSLMSAITVPNSTDWQIEDLNSDIRLNGRTDSSLTIAQSTLSPATWYHMALVSDITAGSTNVYLYLTPQGSSQVALKGSVSDKLFSLQSLRIGANRAGTMTYDSDMAKVKVYDEALGTAALNALLREGDLPDPDPIAHYDFGDGDLTDDDSGNGHTLVGPSGGSATITANNDHMGSAHFDGAGATGNASYFQAALSYTLKTSFTVSFWWKTATLDQDTSDSLMSAITVPNSTDWQIHDSAANIALNGRTDSSLWIAQSTLAAGTWYHMALVSDITAGSTNVYLYLTPQGSSQVALKGSVSDKLFSLQSLRIGANRVGNQTYDSDIAKVKVYDEALWPASLNALLREGDPPPDPDPIARYNFLDGDLTDDEQGNYPLTEYDATKSPGDGGISLQGSYAQFTGSGYLQSDGLATKSSGFTVSYWWRCADLGAEANFEGPGFSTDTGGLDDWQFTVVGTALDFRDTAILFQTAKSNYPDDTWYHTVIRSEEGSNKVTVWISTEGGSLNLVANDVAGHQADLTLKSFTFGTNRNKDGFGTYDLGEARIWDVPVSLLTISTVFDLGPFGPPPPVTQGTLFIIR